MTHTEIMARASEMADKNPPGAAFKSLGVFFENLFFGTFAAVGWTVGRVWWLLFVIRLAIADGYTRGRRKPPEQTEAKPVPPQHRGTDLVDDDRIIDQYQTPFGVPYGPNVHASHD